MRLTGFMLLLVALGLLFWALRDPGFTVWPGVAVASVGFILIGAAGVRDS